MLLHWPSWRRTFLKIRISFRCLSVRGLEKMVFKSCWSLRLRTLVSWIPSGSLRSEASGKPMANRSTSFSARLRSRFGEIGTGELSSIEPFCFSGLSGFCKKAELLGGKMPLEHTRFRRRKLFDFNATKSSFAKANIELRADLSQDEKRGSIAQ